MDIYPGDNSFIENSFYINLIPSYNPILTCSAWRILGELPEVVLGHITRSHWINALHLLWRQRVVDVPRSTGLEDEEIQSHKLVLNYYYASYIYFNK